MSGYSDQIKDLRTKVQTLHQQTKTLYADLDERVKKLSDLNDTKKADEERAIAADQEKLDTMIADGKQMRSSLDQLLFLDDQEQFLNAPAAPLKSAVTPLQLIPERKSWGQLVLDSPEFKRADKTGSTPRMDRVNVKALYGSLDAGGGALIQAQHIPDLMDIPQRPQSILNYITTVNTASDAIEYAVMASRTNNAAFVAERSADGTTFGLKPESDVQFSLATTNVKTLATWIAASRRILMDAPGLQALIDVDLTTMLRVVLENQILSGNGVGENLLGILNTTGTLARTQGVGTSRGLVGDTVADTIRRAISDILVGFYTPNAVIMHPFDAETLELDKGTDGHYTMVFDPASGRLWRIAVAQTAALTAKTALVGDFAMATRLWDRQQTEIRVGEPNDMFLRNSLAVLAELRAAFAVIRPAAILKLTLT